jgi:predicted DNA-binding transcriptional regulator AlpA
MDQDRYMPASAVRTLCGVTDMTLWRWLNDPATAFPQPIKIRRRRYWREGEIREWWEARSREQIAA